MDAILALESGKIFRGRSFGAKGESSGEVVFNTSMSGYQEIITDPSYKGQIIAMTYPLIGNYGINYEDVESRRPFLEGFVVKEYSKVASSWRSKKTLGDYLKENNILGIEGVDTRELTLHIREAGAMKAVLSTEEPDEKKLVERSRTSRGLVGVDLVREVTCQKTYMWEKITGNREPRPREKRRGRQVTGKRTLKVVVIDCGVKYNILRILAEKGCKVVVVPAKTRADEILNMKPDGLLISNGPGDPAAVSYVIETVKTLIGKIPIFGICLGQQILGLALGGKTYKLKFGHHGGNHPVKDTRTGKVYITVQNHGFNVDADSISKKDIEITHINLNDNTMEGIEHRKLPIFSVQFHPEHSPGPRDAEYLFGKFVDMMKR